MWWLKILGSEVEVDIIRRQIKNRAILANFQSTKGEHDQFSSLVVQDVKG